MGFCGDGKGWNGDGVESEIQFSQCSLLFAMLKGSFATRGKYLTRNQRAVMLFLQTKKLVIFQQYTYSYTVNKHLKFHLWSDFSPCLCKFHFLDVTSSDPKIWFHQSPVRLWTRYSLFKWPYSSSLPVNFWLDTPCLGHAVTFNQEKMPQGVTMSPKTWVLLAYFWNGNCPSLELNQQYAFYCPQNTRALLC